MGCQESGRFGHTRIAVDSEGATDNHVQWGMAFKRIVGRKFVEGVLFLGGLVKFFAFFHMFCMFCIYECLRGRQLYDVMVSFGLDQLNQNWESNLITPKLDLLQ